MGSSWTRDWTRIPCIDSWILIHPATREVLACFQGSSRLSQVSEFHAFLRLNSLRGQTTLCLSVLFICWWTLGLLPHLAIVNNAAVNIDVQTPLWDSAFTYRHGIASYKVVLLVTFGGMSVLSFTAAVPFYIPSSHTRIPHSLTNICNFLFFSVGVWGRVSLWLWFVFPWWSVIWTIFSCACWPHVCLLWKMSHGVLCPFLNWIVCLLVVF